MVHQCYHLLKEKSCKSPQCKFLLAKCAYILKLYAEAEGALSSICLGDLKNFDDVVKEFGEIACFALQLIGKICSQTERLPLARDAYKKCLKLNPFLWNVFTDLCNLGDQVDPNSVFQFHSHDIFNTCQGNNDANIVMMPSVQVNNTSDLGNNNGNQLNSSLILSTPIDQILTTPNNNNTLNNSLVILRGGSVPPQNGGGSFEETPLHSYNSADSNMNVDTGTPFRRFKYLTALSPITPSFGILPLNSPGTDTPLNGNIINTTTPSPQTLVENNQESKINLKKLKSHLMTRKDSGVNNTNNKSNVFAAQTDFVFEN
uniref:Cell division cycle protein 27 homolog n=1 Tax=Megaselia scalaris TaxID=36166 RepID=T1GT50_MEGSC